MVRTTKNVRPEGGWGGLRSCSENDQRRVIPPVLRYRSQRRFAPVPRGTPGYQKRRSLLQEKYLKRSTIAHARDALAIAARVSCETTTAIVRLKAAPAGYSGSRESSAIARQKNSYIWRARPPGLGRNFSLAPPAPDRPMLHGKQHGGFRRMFQKRRNQSTASRKAWRTRKRMASARAAAAERVLQPKQPKKPGAS